MANSHVFSKRKEIKLLFGGGFSGCADGDTASGKNISYQLDIINNGEDPVFSIEMLSCL